MCPCSDMVSPEEFADYCYQETVSGVKPPIMNLTVSSAAGKGSLRLWGGCWGGRRSPVKFGTYFAEHFSTCILPKGFSGSEKHRKPQRSIALKGSESTIEISMNLH